MRFNDSLRNKNFKLLYNNSEFDLCGITYELSSHNAEYYNAICTFKIKTKNFSQIVIIDKSNKQSKYEYIYNPNKNEFKIIAPCETTVNSLCCC